MTPSEEVRKLLDERGIKYVVSEGTLFVVTKDVRTYYILARKKGFEVWSEWLTPEQVIAATVGAGTCHYIPDDTGLTWWDENDEEHYEDSIASDECGSASCDKCGHAMMVGDDGWFNGWDEITEWWEEDGSYHKGYVLTPRFKFCPNCGAKVVSE